MVDYASWMPIIRELKPYADERGNVIEGALGPAARGQGRFAKVAQGLRLLAARLDR